MSKVTALKVQARNKNRVNVYLDGEFAFELAKVEAVRLKIGQELGAADIARLKEADEIETTFEKTLHFFSYRQRSEAEVRRYLKKKGLPEARADAVMARLRQAGLIDDAAFAEQWVENRAAFRPKGKRALKAELRAKGVPAQEIEAALAGLNEAEIARQLAAARAEKLFRQKLSRPEFKKKLGDFLARRGFDYETISDAVEQVWRDHGGDTHDDESED